MLEDPPQLAHVAGVAVARQRPPRLGGDARHRRPLGHDVAQEERDQPDEVGLPLREPRDVELDAVQPVVERIEHLPRHEPVGHARARQRDEARAERPPVGALARDGVRRPEQAGEVHLRGRRQRIEPVEHEGAAEGAREPLAAGRQAAVRASPEQIGEHHAVREDERPVAARPLRVQRPRDELLAGAALADDQERHVAPGEDREPPGELAHDGRGRHEHLARRARDRLRARLVELPLERAPLVDRPHDPPRELVGVEGLGDVVHRAVAQRLHDVGDLAVGGHQDDRRLGRLAADPAQQREPAHLRHLHVADGQVEGVRGQEVRGLRAVARFGHLMPRVDEGARHALEHVHVVVGHEDVQHGPGPSQGPGRGTALAKPPPT